MVKPKTRKTRLDKAQGRGGTDFIGFGAFAVTDDSTSSCTTTTTTWSPVYTGSNEQFGALFPRFQKRDAVTVTKCLNDLQDLFRSDEIAKREQVEALWHYAWLYDTKLGAVDASGTVRAAAAGVWKTAYRRIPKAVGNVVTQYPQLLGILFATQTDPSSEVRAVGVAELLLEQQQQQQQQQDWPWERGLVQYTSRILSYGRSSAMHEALGFAGTATTTTNNNSNKTEQDRDAMEERFERLVGNCLDALSLWIHKYSSIQPDNDDEDEDEQQQQQLTPPPSTGWYKTLSSPKPSLRRKTYQLLQAVVINIKNKEAASELLPTNLETILPQAVASEKEAVNIPILLETTLSVLATNDDDDDDSSLQTALVKPVGKVLKKACYSAKVELWGQMLLPLVVKLGNDSSSMSLLQAAYDGVSMTLGETDRWQLLTAIAETASFVLLRKRRPNNSSDTASNDDGMTAVAKLWTQTLSDALLTTAKKKNNNKAASPAAIAKKKLLHDLAKQLLRFCESSLNDGCGFASISDWFWLDGLDLSQSQPCELARLIQELHTERANDSSRFCARLIPKLQQRFLQILNQYQQSSGAVPTEEAYELMQAVLDYCGPLSVFEQDDNGSSVGPALEKFVMNDLLRWTVIHTSSLSTNDNTRSSQQQLVEKDFSLLSICLKEIDVKRHWLWESFLREIIAAKCVPEFLSVGLRTLVQRNDETAWILCEALDNFAIQVVAIPMTSAESTVRAPETMGDDESFDTIFDDDAYEKRLDFYSTCIGTVSETSPRLVGDRVLREWIDFACSSQVPDDVEAVLSIRCMLAALLQVVHQKRSLLLSSAQVDRILTEAWRRPDHLFEVYTSDILSSDPSLRDHFISYTSQELRQDLSSYVAGSCSVDDTEKWSMRTCRMLQTCKDNDEILPSPFFGTEDVTLWQKNPKVMFDLSMALFQRMKAPSDRFALVESWSNGDPAVFLCTILISLSEASKDPVVATKARDRRDRCALFLAAMGSESLENDLVEGVARSIITQLCADLKQQGLDDAIIRGTAVLSQLLDLLFCRVLPSIATELSPDDVVEGARLWYIVDAENPSVREEAVVVKVHYDSQAGYYYTIQIQRDGVSQERQTILNRLRKHHDLFPIGASQLEDDITRQEWGKRSNLRNLVLRDLILPFYFLDDRLYCLGELVNVVVCQLGIGKDRGLGSPHYDIHHSISALEERMRTALADQNTKTAADRLWKLSLSLGFGLNTPSSKWTMQQLRLDPIPSYKILVGYYCDGRIGAQPLLDCSVLAWLIVSFRTALEYQEEAGETLFRCLVLLFRIAGKILEQQDNEAGLSMIACRAVSEGMMLSIRQWSELFQSDETLGSQLSEAKEKALSNLVGAFAAVDTLHSEWVSCSPFAQLLDASLQNSYILESLSSSSLRHADSLACALFDPKKRNLAFLLIDSIAVRRKRLHNVNDEVSLSEETSRLLKTWTNGLEEEETAEVEEDVYIVAEWVPPIMMNELEKWADEEFERFDETIIIGRLMIWLSFLRFIDSAAPLDFRNRPAFVSYLGKCGAIGPILTLAVLHGRAFNDPKSQSSTLSIHEVGDLLKDESSVDITQLASLSLFRTVEVLPSLSKRWWEEECPRVYTNAVQQFVEKQVSPEILKRELERIRTSTSFGPMKVSASLISREVTATYVQDDFSLSVVISLPAAFPFRSAEVDCSKTLGVPQSRWKRWSLQITQILNNQGGTLQDALMLWKENVDKEFEGVEPCPVCYSVLHVKTHKLPSLECKTCHNRFHLDCLTQWFRSSGKSQCVLCQQPWQGSRIQ